MSLLWIFPASEMLGYEKIECSEIRPDRACRTLSEGTIGLSLGFQPREHVHTMSRPACPP